MVAYTSPPSQGPLCAGRRWFSRRRTGRPWGILRFLETKAPTFGQHVNVSFLPVINPTGFRALRRVNDWGEDPNRGFCHNQVDQPALSREGRILLEHLDDLRLLAADGFVSLHEDTEQEQFYLYTFEESDGPGLFSDMLRTVGTKYFPLVPGGIIDGSLINGGLSFRHCDSSFEDCLFHAGVPRTACTETPGLLDIQYRITANAEIIRAFAEYAVAVRR